LAPGAVVVGDIREVSSGPEQFLPTVHLPGKRVLHARDEMRLIGQVCDDRRYMAHPVQTEKGRAALEIDEHQIDGVGRMGIRNGWSRFPPAAAAE